MSLALHNVDSVHKNANMKSLWKAISMLDHLWKIGRKSVVTQNNKVLS